jgi:hypothetical protein
MDDILIHGTERPPSWRRLVATVVIVAAAVGILIAQHLPQNVARAHPRAPTASSGPVQLAGLGSGAAALLNHGRASKHACTPHALVPAESAPENARTRLVKLCSA